MLQGTFVALTVIQGLPESYGLVLTSVLGKPGIFTHKLQTRKLRLRCTQRYS